jgi:hypothetical protein
MDPSQLSCPDIVHSGRKHKFSSFYVHKVSEVLRNTPIYHFGSNGVEWILLSFGTQNSAFRPETQVFRFLRDKFSEVLRNSHIYHFGSNGVEWMLHIFGAPK